MVSKSKKRLLIFILLAVISGFLLYKIVSFYAQSFGPGTIYRQSDPRWANHRVGGSRQTLKAVGCMVCCVSMALDHYGFHFNPAQLNELLKDHGGYSSSGLLQWGAIPKITDNEIEVLPYEKPGLDFIDKSLRNNGPVIVKVRSSRGTNHWVLVVKKENGEYLIKDPAGNGKSLESLSKYHNRIYSARLLRKRT